MMISYKIFCGLTLIKLFILATGLLSLNHQHSRFNARHRKNRQVENIFYAIVRISSI